MIEHPVGPYVESFSFYPYVLKHGQKFSAQAITQSRRRRAKYCFSNAANLAWSGQGYQYVEGFAQSKLGWFGWLHHAWCIDSDEAVIDPTWRPTGLRYFGVVMDYLTLARLITEGAQFGEFLERLAAEK